MPQWKPEDEALFAELCRRHKYRLVVMLLYKSRNRFVALAHGSVFFLYPD